MNVTRYLYYSLLLSPIFYSEEIKEMSMWKFTREDFMDQRRPDKLPVTGSSQAVTRSWKEHR
jgi:hypothetical protein